MRLPALLPTLLTAALLGASGAQAADYPPGFEEQTMVSGLTRPTVVDWTPDGRTLIAEKDGVLKVAGPGASTAQAVLDIRAVVNSGNDRGLLGMAVDSAFEENGFVYLLYTYELSPLVNPDSFGPMVSQLRRVKLNADNTVTDHVVLLGSYTAGTCPPPQNDLDCIPSDEDSHSIGTVRSAPDGTLFVGSGDAASYSEVDQLAFRSYDERSLAGKIMHVDRDGNGLPTHPFCPQDADLDHVCTKLWAKGFRNPFRFTLAPSGELIVGDVGWGRREEINTIPPSGGGSYGWPCLEGTVTNAYVNEPQCQPGQLGPQVPPLYAYPHVEGSDGSAILGGPVYTGGEYPAEYQGSIFFGDYALGIVGRLTRDAEGDAVEHDFADEWFGKVDLESAPDNGDVVYVSFGTGAAGTGSVGRIVYSPGNSAPVAVASADPTFSADVPVTVAFDGSESTDADGDELSYSWDFGDGESSTAQSPSHEYADPGTYVATLTVDDGRGKSDTDVVTIAAGNVPPDAPAIDHPPAYRGGATIELEGSATDPQDGALPASALTWNVRLVHGGHDHFAISDLEGLSEISFVDPANHDADSFYEVALTARDSGGLSTTTTVALDPETTAITLASEPAGALLTYYDGTFTAPLARTTAVGLRTTVSAPQELTFGGQRYVFSSWSDGGARSHQITVPDAPSTLVARYVHRDPPPPLQQLPRSSQPPSARPSRPRLSFDARSGVIEGGKGLRGRASDPDGVVTVRAALYRPLRARRCRFWSAKRARMLAPRRCDRPVWLRARLSGPPSRRTWRVALRGVPPAGAYRLRLRAEDRTGARGSLIGGEPSVRLVVPAG